MKMYQLVGRLLVLDMEVSNFQTLIICVVSAIEFTGVHHVGFLCESVERSLDFYCGLLGTFLSPSTTKITSRGYNWFFILKDGDYHKQ